MTFVWAFPEEIRPYIALTKDVTADGNYGFRAIAGLLGYPEDSWRDIRIKFLSEL